jgi:hypothetical protein
MRRNCEASCLSHQSSSFTIIVLKLRQRIVGNLYRDKSYDELPSTLADIYHFHLHPENLPSTTMKRMRFVILFLFRASISLSVTSVSLAAACFSSSVFGFSSVPSGSIEDEDEVEISPPIGWKDPFRETASGFLHACSIYQGPTTPLDIILEVCCLWLVVSSSLVFCLINWTSFFPLCPSFPRSRPMEGNQVVAI